MIGVLAVLFAFLSASQDIVIDAYRVRSSGRSNRDQVPGWFGTGYRVAMLFAGAGALIIAARAGWFAAYASMAALIGIAMLVFLLAPGPAIQLQLAAPGVSSRWNAFQHWLATAVTGPFADSCAARYGP